MPINVIERAIVPYNSPDQTLFAKNQYSLFAPIADVNKVGMAGYYPTHFIVRDGIVALSPLTAPIKKGDGDYSMTNRDDITASLEGMLNGVTDLEPAKSTGVASAAFGANCNAVGPGTWAIGANVSAGAMAYYFDTIDFSKKTITLSTTRKTLLGSPTYPSKIDWRVGDRISIQNDTNYVLGAKITAVNGNVITVDALPFTSITSSYLLGIYTSPNDRTVVNVDRPTSGAVPIGFGAVAIGGGGTGNDGAYESSAKSTRAVGMLSAAFGFETLAAGTASFAGGRWTEADYASFAYGHGAMAHGEVSFATGRDTKAIGNFSSASGIDTKAQGGASHAEGGACVTGPNAWGAHAEGTSTQSTAYGSHSEGQNTVASADGAHAEGEASKASGVGAHAEGWGTMASGKAAHTEGSSCEATAVYAHAEGNTTKATSESDHAEGGSTVASGGRSHAEGTLTHATAWAAHAEGNGSTAEGHASHAEGRNTVASNEQSHAEGYWTTASGEYAHAEGHQTTASNRAAHAEGYLTTASGGYAHAEGWNTVAEQRATHAEGCETKALYQYAHAEGYQTTASNQAAHAEGFSTTASGWISHAEGNTTTASGTHAHSEGQNTIASGHCAHAEGQNTQALGDYSHAGGHYTIASKSHQTAIGCMNATDPDAMFMIGNGNVETGVRSNAFVVRRDGTMSLGGVTVTPTQLAQAVRLTQYRVRVAPKSITWHTFVERVANYPIMISARSTVPTILEPVINSDIMLEISDSYSNFWTSYAVSDSIPIPSNYEDRWGYWILVNAQKVPTTGNKCNVVSSTRMFRIIKVQQSFILDGGGATANLSGYEYYIEET